MSHVEQTCELVIVDGFRGIKCLRCGKTSFHPQDIYQRYCARCNRFHDEASVFIRVFHEGRWQSVSLASLSDAERAQYRAQFRKEP